MFTQQQIVSATQGKNALLVAFSGGLDSTVLLHQLFLLRQQHAEITLRAIHIHHGLSANADSWVAHCQRQCAERKIPFIVEYVQIDAQRGGIEAAARTARYAAMAAHLQAGECLVTAQHLDDQCETFLLALKRGSGPAGLAAMPEHKTFAQGLHWRPLLNLSRCQLEQWAAQQKLCWIEDESNQQSRYDRNFLRQHVLPVVNARWPHFASATARSAALCAEQEQLLDELLAEALAAATQADGGFCFSALSQVSVAQRNALLRRWLAQQGSALPSREALQRLWLEVIQSREDANPRFSVGEKEIRRFQGALYLVERLPDLSATILPWEQTRFPLTLPAGLGTLQVAVSGTWIRMPRADEQVSVRFAVSGHYHVVGRSGGRSLKKIWQERGVPPWQRERTPLVFYNDLLITAPGVFVTREGEAQPEQAGWHLCWQR